MCKCQQKLKVLDLTVDIVRLSGQNAFYWFMPKPINILIGCNKRREDLSCKDTTKKFKIQGFFKTPFLTRHSLQKRDGHLKCGPSRTSVTGYRKDPPKGNFPSITRQHPPPSLRGLDHPLQHHLPATQLHQ